MPTLAYLVTNQNAWLVEELSNPSLLLLLLLVVVVVVVVVTNIEVYQRHASKMENDHTLFPAGFMKDH